jgi:hypothetical protein
MNEQAEIPIPAQPPRITLHRARVMRDVLEKSLSVERPALASDVTAVALQFNGADNTYRKIRWQFYRKRSLDQLRTLGRFIAALEQKSSRKSPPPGLLNAFTAWLLNRHEHFSRIHRRSLR